MTSEEGGMLVGVGVKAQHLIGRLGPPRASPTHTSKARHTAPVQPARTNDTPPPARPTGASSPKVTSRGLFRKDAEGLAWIAWENL